MWSTQVRRAMFYVLVHGQRTCLLQIASKLDVIYALSASWGETESSEDFEMLEKKLTALRPDELIFVILSPPCIPLSRQNTAFSKVTRPA